MGNKAFLNQDKHYGEFIMEGDQTSASIMQLMQTSLALSNQMSQQYGAVHMLADVSGMGKLDIGSRAAATKSINIGSFDKLAIVGATPDNRKLIDMMIGLSGKQAQIEFFASRDEAEAWLSG